MLEVTHVHLSAPGVETVLPPEQRRCTSGQRAVAQCTTQWPSRRCWRRRGHWHFTPAASLSSRCRPGFSVLDPHCCGAIDPCCNAIAPLLTQQSTSCPRAAACWAGISIGKCCRQQVSSSRMHVACVLQQATNCCRHRRSALCRWPPLWRTWHEPWRPESSRFVIGKQRLRADDACALCWPHFAAGASAVCM